MAWVNLDEVDDLFVDAGRLALEMGQISVSMIQRRLKTGYARANRIMSELIKSGVVKQNKSPHFPCASNMTQESWDAYLETCRELAELDRFGKEWFGEDVRKDMDDMTGEEFERLCADVLSKNGFDSVGFTTMTGDHGVDLTASKDDLRYVFQCKCYSSAVGNDAIQEAFSGKAIYGADVAVVITNNYFTPQAKKDAARLRVFLWDRDKLQSLMAKA